MPYSTIEKLIKSLKQGELRAFSLKVKQNKAPEYFNLFKQIKKGKVHDNKENAQRRKYLYDSLLDSLNKKTDSIDANILKKLLNTETLFKRQLIKEAWKEVNKAQRLAQKHERFGFFIQILEWKKSIGFYLETFTRQDYFELLRLEEKALNQQLMYLKTKNLYMEILNLKKEMGYLPLNFDKEKFIRFEMEIPPEVISKRTLFYSRITKAIYYWMQKKHEQEYQLTKQNVLETDVDIDYAEYMIAHLEHLTSCVCNASFNELVYTMHELRDKYKQGYFGNNVNIELKLFYYAANYEVMSYVFMGKQNLLKEKIIEVEQGIAFWIKNLSKEMLIIIYSALKMGYYFLGDTKKSKYYVNKMLNESNKNIRKDAFDDATLFNLIIVFDKHDVEYQESVINKTVKYFKSSNMKDSFEYKFALSLKKNLFDNKIFHKVYDDMENQFNKYFYKLSDGRLYSENYLPIYIWLLSKIKNKPLLNVTKNWYVDKL